jgi:hypothetical protein
LSDKTLREVSLPRRTSFAISQLTAGGDANVEDTVLASDFLAKLTHSLAGFRYFLRRDDAFRGTIGGLEFGHDLR